MLLWSLGFNALLLFCLLAPNIVYIIHRHWFKWREEKENDKVK